MKKMLVAVALALVPLTVSPALASTVAGSSKASKARTASAAAERPKICFEFAFWKYCI
jgi:hypothetical protein